MTSWIPYVFVRVVIFFIGGITLGIYFPDLISFGKASVVLIIFILSYLCLYIVRRYSQSRVNVIGFIALSAIFISGYLCVILNDQRSNPHHLSTFNDIQFYKVVITSHPQERERSWKFEGDIEAVRTTDWMKAAGKIMLYLSKDSALCPYDYGDILIVTGTPLPVPPPGNPGEFDYKKFLSYKNIFHQHFIRKHDVIKVNNDPPYKFIQLAIKARIWADVTLQQFIRGEREQATISALVLGVTDGLDNELLNAYAGTGAMHVLAVSGLHISIVYLLISFVLSPLKKIKHGKAILAVVSILILWTYSFITGLSPSVLRAVVMFTFMALARASDRQTNIYNTLAVAAFCLLLYDPYLIMSVGFQLSFFAVIGILYFHPFIYAWWQPQNWLLNEIWTVTSVSIAAQVSTFPLGLLYFHQFPNYFLLANLFVIPGSFVVLLGGILLLILSIVPMIADLIGWLLSWIIKLLNNIVFFFESLPYSLIENIYISIFQSYVLAAIIVFVTLLCVKRRLAYLKVAIALGIIFSAGQWFWISEMHTNTWLAVYKVPGHFAVDIIHDGMATFIADSAFQKDFLKQKFHIKPNRIIHAVDQVALLQPLFQSDEFDVFVCGQQRILRIKRREAKIPAWCRPNLIIVGNNGFNRLSMPAEFQNVVIVLDSSNSFYFADKVINDKENEGLVLHSVLHRGAFEISLNTGNHGLRDL